HLFRLGRYAGVTATVDKRRHRVGLTVAVSVEVDPPRRSTVGCQGNPPLTVGLDPVSLRSERTSPFRWIVVGLTDDQLLTLGVNPFDGVLIEPGLIGMNRG